MLIILLKNTHMHIKMVLSDKYSVWPTLSKYCHCTKYFTLKSILYSCHCTLKCRADNESILSASECPDLSCTVCSCGAMPPPYIQIIVPLIRYVKHWAVSCRQDYGFDSLEFWDSHCRKVFQNCRQGSPVMHAQTL